MKDLKDYLHLYLPYGIKCHRMGMIDENTDEAIVSTLTGISWDGTQNIWWAYFDNTEDSYGVLDDTFPILRKLSDMTEDEAVELVKIQTPEKRHNSIDIQEITANHIWYIDGEMWYGDGVSELYDKYIKFNEISAEQFRYLLSRGFDLFNLIPEGLALDKTTLTQQ